MADVKITDEIRDVLERSHFSSTAIRLPEQLDRRLYEQVNTVLVFAGCKWSRKDKAHIFQGDARSTIDSYLQRGVAPDEKKAFQSFYTPPDFADELADKACVRGKTVLEPSAGGGALALACMNHGAYRVDLFEIRPEACVDLRLAGFLVVRCVDFLTVDPQPLYERVVMNPPFSNNQDVAHVRHALKFLTPGGVLVSVMAGNQNRKPLDQLCLELSDGQWMYSVEPVEFGRFKESGTNVGTFVFTVQKVH